DQSEWVKTIADGMDDALEIVEPNGTAVYRNQALERLIGRGMGRVATLEEGFAGEPQSAEAFYRLNRAAEREEARDEEFHVRSQGGMGRRWLRVSVRPFRAASGHGKRKRLTLWQVRDVTHERTREIETVSSLKSTLQFYDELPQGLFAVAADGRIVHLS